MSIRITLIPFATTNDPAHLSAPQTLGDSFTHDVDITMAEALKDYVPLMAYRMMSNRHPFDLSKPPIAPRPVFVVTLEQQVQPSNNRGPIHIRVITFPNL